MRIDVQSNKMDSSGFEESTTLGIADAHAAKIFRVLTESLYSSGAAAMARELISNAIDESPYATRPFVVSIPTRMNPVFCLRDYGRGMSHGFMMTRAFSLGDSTKDGRGLADDQRTDETDSTIGGFGLGMKTPFILCDQFTITVYRGFTAQTYVIDKPDGLPRVQTSDSMIRPLTEHETGTEITVTLPESRAQELQKGIARVLEYLNPALYSVHGSIDFKPVTFTYESDSYSITKENQNSFVLLGPIAYPIDSAALGFHSWTDYPGKNRIAIKLGAGALEVTGSRESIKWTPRSVEIVKQALESALDDIRIRINDSLLKAETLWEACTLHTEQKGLAMIIGNDKAANWRGVDMARSYVIHCVAHWSRHNFFEARRRKIVSAFSVNGLKQNRSHVFLLDDDACKRNTLSRRIERAFRNNPGTEYVSVINRGNWLFAFVGAPVQSIMDYEPVTLETTRATRDKESKVYRLSNGGNYLVRFEHDSGGFYIPFNRSSTDGNWLNQNPGWNRLYNSSWFQAKGKSVYGINQSLLKGLDLNLWRDAFDWARECMHAELGIVKDWLAYRSVTQSPLYCLAIEPGFKTGNRLCDSLLADMRTAQPTTPRNHKLESDMVELIAHGLIEALPQVLPNLEKEVESLLKKYPCADYVLNHSYAAKRLELMPRAFG